MKNKITTILIILLTAISCVLIGIVIYQSKNYVKIPKQYRCETEEKNVDSINYKQIIIVNIDKEQYVENYQSKNVNVYLNQEQYEVAKTLENTDSVTYSYNDDKKTVLIDYGTSYVQSSDGQNINIWYKEYIKNLESIGFNCKIVK